MRERSGPDATCHGILPRVRTGPNVRRRRGVASPPSLQAWGGWVLRLRTHDADDRRQGNELAALVPPLRLAHVARGERQIAAGGLHADRDEVTRSALGT